MPISKTFKPARTFDLSVETKRIAAIMRACGFAPANADLERFNNAIGGQSFLDDQVKAWYSAALGGVLTDSAGGAYKVLNITKGTKPEYFVLSGVNGSNLSTPDSAASSIFTTGIDLRCLARFANWIPGTSSQLIAKEASPTQRSYGLRLNADGTFQFNWSNDGTANLFQNSTVSNTVMANSQAWVRATLAFDNGTGNYEIRFYTSTNGNTWTQVGSTIVGTGTTSIADTTAPLEVGSRLQGTSTPLNGSVYRAEIRNSIDGPAVAVMDARQASETATTWVSATGETWTQNGGGGCQLIGNFSLFQNTASARPAITYDPSLGLSTLVFDGVDDFLKSAAFALGQPTTVYLLAKQVSYTSTDVLYDGNGDSSMQLYQGGASGRLVAWAGGTGVIANGTSIGSYVLVTVTFNGTSGSINVNNSIIATGDMGTANGNGFTLGSRGTALSLFSNLQFIECIIRSGVDSAATQTKYQNYLARLANLSI